MMYFAMVKTVWISSFQYVKLLIILKIAIFYLYNAYITGKNELGSKFFKK